MNTYLVEGTNVLSDAVDWLSKCTERATVGVVTMRCADNIGRAAWMAEWIMNAATFNSLCSPPPMIVAVMVDLDKIRCFDERK